MAIAGATGAFGSASGAPVQTAYTAYVVSHVEHALASPGPNNLLEQDRTVFAAGNGTRRAACADRGYRRKRDLPAHREDRR